MSVGGRGWLLLLLGAVLAVAACSGRERKETPEYFNARVLPSLQVPPDLDAPYRAEAMRLPEEAFTLSISPDTDVESLAKPPHIIEENRP